MYTMSVYAKINLSYLINIFFPEIFDATVVNGKIPRYC